MGAESSDLGTETGGGHRSRGAPAPACALSAIIFFLPRPSAETVKVTRGLVSYVLQRAASVWCGVDLWSPAGTTGDVHFLVGELALLPGIDL